MDLFLKGCFVDVWCTKCWLPKQNSCRVTFISWSLFYDAYSNAQSAYAVTKLKSVRPISGSLFWLRLTNKALIATKIYVGLMKLCFWWSMTHKAPNTITIYMQDLIYFLNLFWLCVIHMVLIATRNVCRLRITCWYLFGNAQCPNHSFP